MSQDFNDNVNRDSAEHKAESHINLISVHDHDGDKAPDHNVEAIRKALEANEKEIAAARERVADIARRAALCGADHMDAMKQCAGMNGPAYRELQKHLGS